MDGKLELTLLDQHSYNGYIHLFLCFPESNKSSDEAVYTHLRKSLSKFSDAFPVIKGHIVHNTSNSTHHITYSPSSPAPPFCTQDVRSWHTIPSYASLQDSNFHMLGPLFYALNYDDRKTDGTAVFMLLVSRIEGGLVLGFSAHHFFVDAEGFGVLIEMYAEACRGEKGRFDGELLVRKRAGWLDGSVERLDLVSTLSSERATSVSSEIPTTTSPALQETSLAPSSSTPQAEKQQTTLLITATSTSLQTLKATLISKLPQTPSTTQKISAPYISTTDSFIALLYTCLIRARFPHVPFPSDTTITTKTTCTLTSAVSLRRRLTPPLPREYIGNCVGGASISVSLASIIGCRTAPVHKVNKTRQDEKQQEEEDDDDDDDDNVLTTSAHIASHLRHAINSISSTTLLHHLAQLSTIQDLPGAFVDNVVRRYKGNTGHLQVSSWARMFRNVRSEENPGRVAALDFGDVEAGGLGSCEAARVFVGSSEQLVVHPHLNNGDERLVVGSLNLERGVLERLMKIQELRRWVVLDAEE